MFSLWFLNCILIDCSWSSWRTKWQPTPVFLPREFHGQRSLAGSSPWSCKESDMTEQLTHTADHQTRVLKIIHALLLWPIALGRFIALAYPVHHLLKKYLLIYLAASGLNYCMQDLCCVTWDLSLCCVGLVAPWDVGSYFPNQGSDLCPLRCRQVLNHWMIKDVPLCIVVY